MATAVEKTKQLDTQAQKTPEVQKIVLPFTVDEKYMDTKGVLRQSVEQDENFVFPPKQKFSVNISGVEYNVEWKGTKYVFVGVEGESAIYRPKKGHIISPYRGMLKPGRAPVVAPSSITSKTKKDLQKAKDIVSAQVGEKTTKGVDVQKSAEVSDTLKKTSDTVQKAMQNAPKKAQEAVAKTVTSTGIDMDRIRKIPFFGTLIAAILTFIQSFSPKKFVSNTANKVKGVLDSVRGNESVKLYNVAEEYKKKYDFLKEKADKQTLANLDSAKSNPRFQKQIINFLHASYKKGYPITLQSVSLSGSKTGDKVSANVFDIRYKGSPKIPVEIVRLGAKSGLFNQAEIGKTDKTSYFQDAYTGSPSTRDKAFAAMKTRGTLPVAFEEQKIPEAVSGKGVAILRKQNIKPDGTLVGVGPLKLYDVISKGQKVGIKKKSGGKINVVWKNNDYYVVSTNKPVRINDGDKLIPYNLNRRSLSSLIGWNKKNISTVEVNDSASTKEKYKYLQEHAGKRTVGHIDKLKPNPDFRKRVIDFIYMSYTNNYPIVITSSVRSLATQREYVRKGVSKTLNSQHLKHNAIDIMYNKGFNIPLEVRRFAAKCGIFSGAEMWGWDEPHFQGIYTGRASKKKATLRKMQARGTLPAGYTVNGNKSILT